MSIFENNILLLFRNCLDLRQAFNQLDKKADNIQEISMNATVAAGQTGRFIKIYSEIARQIAISARKMKSQIGDSRTEINNIVNLTLNALVLDLKLQKYIQAKELGIKKAENQKILDDVITEQVAKIHQQMVVITEYIHETKSILRNLKQTQYRLFAGINSLLVESTDLEGHQLSTVILLSKNLTQSAEFGVETIDHLFDVLQVVRDRIQIINNRSETRSHCEQIYTA